MLQETNLLGREFRQKQYQQWKLIILDRNSNSI